MPKLTKRAICPVRTDGKFNPKAYREASLLKIIYCLFVSVYVSPVPSADNPLGGEFEFTVRPEDLDNAGIYYFKVVKKQKHSLK